MDYVKMAGSVPLPAGSLWYTVQWPRLTSALRAHPRRQESLRERGKILKSAQTDSIDGIEGSKE